MKRDDGFFALAYMAGAVALSIIGPNLWDLPATYASLASCGAAGSFAIGHWGWRRWQWHHAPRLGSHKGGEIGDDLGSGKGSSRFSEHHFSQRQASNDRVDMMKLRRSLGAQPIMSLPSGQACHYSIAPFHHGGSDLLMDTKLRLSEAILLARLAEERHSHARIFFPVADSIMDDAASREEFFSLAEQVDATRRLIFELSPEAAAFHHPASVSLRRLTAAGFHICVRLRRAADLPQALMGTIRKLPASAFDTLTEGDVVAARRCGLTLIATDLFNTAQAAKALSLGIRYGEGVTIAGPKSQRLLRAAA